MELITPDGKPYSFVVVDANTRLFLGDAADVLRDLPPVDLLLTDPPYGIGFASQPTNSQRANSMQATAWDDDAVPFPLLQQAIQGAQHAIVWGGNYYPLPPSRAWLAWIKEGNAPSMADMEMAWCSYDANARTFRKTVKAASLEKDLQRWPHPSVKPVDLMEWCISQADKQRHAARVLDPFMGTGSTGVAAAHMHREFIGVERDPRYFGYAVERIAEAKRQGHLFSERDATPAMEQMALQV